MTVFDREGGECPLSRTAVMALAGVDGEDR